MTKLELEKRVRELEIEIARLQGENGALKFMKPFHPFPVFPPPPAIHPFPTKLPWKLPDIMCHVND